ncbi:MAG: glycosyltransferase family 4 protein [Bacteroidota bacterium]
MNILILHGSSDLYGASKILLVTVRMLRKKGFHPIIVLTEPGPLSNALESEGFETVYMRLGILRRKYKTIPGMVNRFITIRKAIAALKKLVREKNTQLIYSNTTAVLAGAFAAKATGIRHVWHIHEIIEQPKWLFYLLGNMVNRYSTRVIVVSEAVKKSWGRYVSAEKMARVYNGIEYAPYQQPSSKLREELGLDEQTIVIGMIGRVHHWKGQEYFVEIASQLAKQYKSVHFVMIGDVFPGYEYLYKSLAKQKKEAGIESLVTDLGYRTDVATLLQGFDIFVLPSTLPDPFPTVILEAMAAGKPVVATRHGGAMEMIDESVTGFLMPVNDAEKASMIIGKLVNDKALRLQMGQAGRQKVLSQYSLEAFEQEMIKVLE